jgi:predicted transcriptional regulator
MWLTLHIEERTFLTLFAQSKLSIRLEDLVARAIMDGLEKLLHLLADGTWHSITELSSLMGWTPAKTKYTLEQLADLRFVFYQAYDESARIDAQLRTLLQG